jgi:hypothetical protein
MPWNNPDGLSLQVTASYRIKRLKSEKVFGDSPQTIFKKQDFVKLKYVNWPFSKYFDNDSLKTREFYIIEIPTSRNYDTSHSIYFTDHYFFSYNDEEKFGLKIWGSLSGYDNSFNNPIPNDVGAKEFEERSFAMQIIHSLRTLKMCREQLPLIEQEASKAFVFETTLKKMKMDLEYYTKRQTASAEEKVQEYKEFQNRLVKLIGDFKEKLTIKTEIKDEELNEVIEAF